MKKILIVLGLLGCYACTAEKGQLTELTLVASNGVVGNIYKLYDSGYTCYVMESGISCLRP